MKYLIFVEDLSKVIWKPLKKFLHCIIRIRFICLEDFVDFSYDRQGQDVRYALNDDKLRALGWKPQINFDTELKYIVEYYREKFIW
jgi:dTDP-D-glucose 4,6-dehydratase